MHFLGKQRRPRRAPDAIRSLRCRVVQARQEAQQVRCVTQPCVGTPRSHAQRWQHPVQRRGCSRAQHAQTRCAWCSRAARRFANACVALVCCGVQVQDAHLCAPLHKYLGSSLLLCGANCHAPVRARHAGVSGRTLFLGSHTSEDEAARAYVPSARLLGCMVAFLDIAHAGASQQTARATFPCSRVPWGRRR